jgi:hypothetical protein
MSHPPFDTPPYRAVWEVLRTHGITPDRCEVLQDGNTLVLRLSETLVVRVLQDLTGPRVGPDWFARETAIAAHLSQMGAPIIPLHPDLPAGPHLSDGHPLNCWQYVTVLEAPPSASELAVSLHQCHEALRSYAGELPHLAILHEAVAMLRQRVLFETSVQDMLLHHLEGAVDHLAALPAQALHGDAHLGNALLTTRGPLWADWEDVFLGPVEWDLASVIWNASVLVQDHAFVQEVLNAYGDAGGDWHEEVLATCMTARAAVMTAWYPILYPKPDSTRREKLQRRLEWLQQRR